jgi:autotransporter-associated beta strand protein
MDSTGFSNPLNGSMSINSLRFGAADAASTVAVGSGNILRIASGGILVAPTVATGTPSILGGILTGAGGAGSELIVHQHNTGSVFEIGSSMLQGTILTKTGAGTLLLSGVNNYRGDTNLYQGTLAFANGSGTGTFSQVVMKNLPGVTLDLQGGSGRLQRTLQFIRHHHPPGFYHCGPIGSSLFSGPGNAQRQSTYKS